MQKQAISSLSMSDARLVSEAREATYLSYAPYSHFRVGAAVQLANGETVKGGNQENASYPCGICAERSALATAQNLYPGVPITAIAIASSRDDAPTVDTATSGGGIPTTDIITPCGMCRQVIAEAEHRYKSPIRIIMTSCDDAVTVSSISDLLPLSFKKTM